MASFKVQDVQPDLDRHILQQMFANPDWKWGVCADGCGFSKEVFYGRSWKAVSFCNNTSDLGLPPKTLEINMTTFALETLPVVFGKSQHSVYVVENHEGMSLDNWKRDCKDHAGLRSQAKVWLIFESSQRQRAGFVFSEIGSLVDVLYLCDSG